MKAIFKCGACGKEFVADNEWDIGTAKETCEDHEIECYQTSIRAIKEKQNIGLAKSCKFCVFAKVTHKQLTVECEKLKDVEMDGGAVVGVCPKVYECCPLFEQNEQVEQEW